MKLYNGYERLSRNYTLMTDAYEFTMANGYLEAGKEKEEAVFDVFFRKVPSNGGYAVMAGLDKVIPFIENLNFGEQELDYFRRSGYSEKFIDYLKGFEFHGDIYAVPDGTPVFPNEPILTVKAPIIEAQVVETALLSIINGAMEHATGARRIIEATPKGVGVMEFGARRADGLEAAIDASIYGVMAGYVGTSNIIAADMMGMKAMGTQAHSWIESFPTEYDAFLSYAKTYPDNCILLVDTIDTLRSGIPNAIKVFEQMRKEGISTDHIGIRIDSGDLAYLSKEARKMLRAAGFPEAKICLSNGLTAETIEALIAQGAEFDSLGVGDNISKPEGRMGCVYKEVALEANGILTPKIKLSNDTIKIVNPGFKELYRAFDKNTGYAIADFVTLKGEKVKESNLTIISLTDQVKRGTINYFDLVRLQRPIFMRGKLVYDDPTIEEKRSYCEQEMSRLYPEERRTRMPHVHYVDGTEKYMALKTKMINDAKQLVKR